MRLFVSPFGVFRPELRVQGIRGSGSQGLRLKVKKFRDLPIAELLLAQLLLSWAYHAFMQLRRGTLERG